MPVESVSKLQPESASGANTHPAFESSSVFASFCLTPAGEFLRGNRAFLDIVGCSSAAELAHRNFRKEILVNPGDWAHWERAALGHRITGKEITLRGEGDRSFVLKGDIWQVRGPQAEPGWLQGTFVDITEAKHLRAAVQRAARSEALGSLASGMIHDFKNLLTVLIGNLYLIAEGVRDRPVVFDQARRARDMAKRGAQLTQDVLAFARESSTATQTLDPTRLLANLKPMLDHAVGSRVALDLAVAAEVSPIRVSAAQLESVVLNLVINAHDAITDTGSVAITLGDIVLDADRAAELHLSAGKYVSIAVEDDGSGIPETVRLRIFEPFYSTKEEGRGTGLGLTMVKWFVESSSGAVELESELGRGTKVTLLLPAAREQPDASPSMTMPLSSLPGGHESVLVVARDSGIADTLRDSLVVLGYGVDLSHDPAELARLLGSGTFDLVLIDSSAVTSGTPRRMAMAIRQKFPGIRTIVVVNSGSRERDGGGHSPALSKPFALKDLAVLVRHTLDRETNV